MGYNIVKGLIWLALIESDKLDKPPHAKSYTFSSHSKCTKYTIPKMEILHFSSDVI